MLILSWFLVGCSGGSNSGAATDTKSNEAPQLAALFVDVTAGSGIDYELAFAPLEPGIMREITYGGAAAGDYDGDGDIDLFVVRGNLMPNLLYENVGNLSFVDVAPAAGLAYTRSATENYAHSGPGFADMDGDGDLDLFLGGLSGDPSLIFENNGDKTFTDVTADAGIDGLRSKQNVSVAFGDYDLDGDIDLFVAHWENSPVDETGDTGHLWRNDSDPGTIRFTSVSEQALISPSVLSFFDDTGGSVRMIDWTFTPTFARIDDDLYPDILSVADYNGTEVFMNNGDGTFTNATNPTIITDDNGMGSAVGDYDDDGDLDWFVSSIYRQPMAEDSSVSPGPNSTGNRLYRNEGGVFVDQTESSGVRNGGWGWAACMFDFENDGDLDIYHTNGWSADEAYGDFHLDSSRAFVSVGAGRFENHADQLGLDDTKDARGAVCADFDNDGDVDILQLHDAGGLAATLWKNDGAVNNFLRVKLAGLPPNTEAAGARIKARIGSVTRMREITIGSNYIAQNPTVQIFGLGTAARVDELTIEWPDAESGPTVMTDVLANQTLTVAHPSL